jgi:hypothetical protein
MVRTVFVGVGIVDIVSCGCVGRGGGGGFSYVLVIIGCSSFCGRGANSICGSLDDNVKK